MEREGGADGGIKEEKKWGRMEGSFDEGGRKTIDGWTEG